MVNLRETSRLASTQMSQAWHLVAYVCGEVVSNAHRLNFYPEARLPCRLLPCVSLRLFQRHSQLCLPFLLPGSCGSGQLTSLDGFLKGLAPGAAGTGDLMLCLCDKHVLKAGTAGHWEPRGDKT